MTTDESELDAVDEPAAETRTNEDDSEADRLRRYMNRAVLVGLLVVGAVAALRFYFAASNTVDYWVADAYRSLFQAAFNLAVLLVVAAGVRWQLRRLSSDDETEE